MTSRDGGTANASVVILVADGARPDTLAAAMDRGDLPALARLRAEGGSYVITSVFPSVTGPAYAPFLMGRFPGPVGLPGIRWFDRARDRTRWPDWSRSYVGFDYAAIGGDIDPATPTIFELAPSRLGALAVIERGLRPGERVARGPGFALRAALTHFRGDPAGWLELDRTVAARAAARIARETPRYAFCALTGIDKASHGAGHDSTAARRAMQVVDETAARIRADAERDGRWESMHLWIVSDHGHSPVRTHDDLAGFVRSRGLGVRAHPWSFGLGHDVAVMVSGNAMAHLYVDIPERERRWWPALAPRWTPLAEALLERASTDLLVLPISSDEVEVRSRARGAARIRLGGGRFTHEPLSGDPLGLGALRDIDSADAHAVTLETDYPDSLVQLTSLAASPRCGDLLISAARDWDLRAKWEPIPHVSAHGALHREHMAVPLLVNRPATRLPRRTVDVFATALHALGITPPAGIDGHSWL